MQVSLSPNVNSYNNFKAEQPKKSTNVLDNALSEKNKLSEKDKLEIQSKKVKSAVKRCIGVIILLDVIYFTMRHSFKYTKIDKIAKKQGKRADVPKPLKGTVSNITQLKETYEKLIQSCTGSESCCAGLN